MKKSNLILAAIASVALASCSNEEYFGDPSGLTGERAISFDMSTPAMTRAETGETAANTLNRNFVLYGYKTFEGTHQLVFDNYQANYVENTAGKTNSNLNNWEYVGYKNLYNGVPTNIGVTATTNAANYDGIDQSIKYWDFNAKKTEGHTTDGYDFFAYSLGKGATVGANTTYAKATKMTDTGYTLTGTNAELAACYISDIVHIETPTTTTNVQFKFRTLNSKIRIGIYEIVPGYSIKDVKFYVDANTLSDENTSTDDKDGLVPTLYASDNVLPNGGSYTVSFDGEGAANVAFSGENLTNTISFGALSGFVNKDYKETAGEVYLGRTANNATKTAYQTFLPNPTGTNLTLKVDYTLVSRDGTGETIEVKGAIANVPQLYAQWKPGYAYTYLFKISNSNGEIGGVAGLYPITFDAVVEEVETADGKVQETISTVATPSITTYQNGTKDLNEYKINEDIFVVVYDNKTTNALLELNDATNHPTNIYKVSASPERNPETYTEAEIIKALQVVQSQNDLTIVGRNGITLTKVTNVTSADDYGTDKWMITNQIDKGVDGQPITGLTSKVAKFKSSTAGFYAFVYTDEKSATNVDKYEAVAELTAGTSVAPYYWYYKYVTDEDAIEGATYYTQSGEDPNFTYTVGAPDPAFFLGQKFAAGLYTKDGDTYTLYTDYVKSDGTYYLTDGAADPVATITYAQCKTAISATESSEKLYSATSTDNAVTDATAITADGTYYKLTGGDGSNASHFTRCVILPENTGSRSTKYYRLVTSETIEKCPAGEQAVVGKRYYDKYTQNQTTYAVKVIKVQ